MVNIKAVIKILKAISVEPILFIISLAFGIHHVVYRYGVYHAICEQMTGNDCPEIGSNGSANASSRAVENAVQRATADFGTHSSLAYTIPAIFADILLGALGDRYGRKLNILSGIVGDIIFIFPTIFLYKYPRTTPLYVLLIASVISGFTGFVSIILISSFAYLADTVIDQDTLTIRMAILQVVINAGQMLGPLIGGALSLLLESAYQEVITISLLVLSIILCLVMLRQVPPLAMKARVAETRDKGTTKEAEPQAIEIEVIDRLPRENPVRRQKWKANLVVPADIDEASAPSGRGLGGRRLCLETVQLMKEVWSTYVKPRENHRRAYLLIMSAVFFATFTAESGLRYGVLALYVQKAPLNWNQFTLGSYDSAHGAAIMTGTLVGSILLKRVFHLSDTMLILIALASAVAEMIIVALAGHTWLLFFSATIGCLANLVKPCSKSFVAKLVDADEVGKAYTVFGIAQNVAFMVSTVFYNSLYKATLEFFPGFSFIVAACVFLIAFFLVLGVYLDSKRQGRLY